MTPRRWPSPGRRTIMIPSIWRSHDDLRRSPDSDRRRRARAAGPARPRGAARRARALIDKYGRPAQFDSNALAWFNNGIWKRTIVYRRGPIAGPNRDKQFLSQSVGYIVPAD